MLQWFLLMSCQGENQSDSVFAFLCGQFRKKMKIKSPDGFILIKATNQM